ATRIAVGQSVIVQLNVDVASRRRGITEGDRQRCADRVAIGILIGVGEDVLAATRPAGAGVGVAAVGIHLQRAILSVDVEAAGGIAVRAAAEADQLRDRA